MNTTLLFNTLRLIPISTTLLLTDEGMVKAITLNENIKSMYGLTFKPEDLVKIAKSDTDVLGSLCNAIPEIKAKPMYPDFPSQVMEMDEAAYRFHQMIHYFSTYGLEFLFDMEVNKGWLPDVKDTEKIKEDKSLFDLKVIEVVEDENVEKVVLEKLTQKKERMTSDERELVSEAVRCVTPEFLKTLSVSFKENLQDIFLCVVDNTARSVSKDVMTTLCQHSGDVLKCIKYYLGKHRYKISTSQKKLFVKMLETFSDFKENIMLSNMKREEVLVTLQYLDYNIFSRSSFHKEAVAELRNGTLKSWYSKVEKAFKEDIREAINLLSKRPGEFLRRINEGLNRGMSVDDILNNIEADKLSLPTLVRLNTFFDSTESLERFEKNKLNLITIVRRLLFNYFTVKTTPLAGKKIFVEEGLFDFDNSIIETNTKSNMSGYIPSGIAYKIPDEARIVRFFTYWNDKERIDIDLHARAVKKNGEEVHIGWNGDYKNSGMCMSGDITHSDAAEFIDIDLSDSDVKRVFFNIHDYTEIPFNNIDKVLCGLMAVSELGVEKDYKLYTPKNCFFSNEVKEKVTRLNYGYLDVEKRIVRLVGKEGSLHDLNTIDYNFSLRSYLNTMFAAQNITEVDKKEDADVVVRLDKGEEGEMSLIDEHFFLEC